MAYVIGSDKGKEIAKNMSAGSTYKASDGSTWTKNSDGSVSVTTSKGEIFNNAYTPTSSSTSSSSSSKGTSGGNSQYTQYTPVGTHNDASLPDDAKAQIEIYKNMYNEAIASGNKDAADAAHRAAELIRKQYGYSGGDDGSEYLELPNKTYSSWLGSNAKPSAPQTDPRIEELLNQILNREDFSYDVMDDPLYQQYANIYQREGDRAMRDTLAEVATGAGGMNSYAITAAQQAANYYNSQLNDRIPELYQLAYEMYLNDKESKVQDLGILQGMDDTQYNRYRNTMSDWKDDRNFAYGMYQDDVAQNNWQTQFDYNSMWDSLNFANNNIWNNKNYDTQQSQREQDIAREDAWSYISMGVMPSADLISRAGMSVAEVEAAVAAVKAEKAEKTTSKGSSGSSGSGGSGSSGNGYTGGGGSDDFTLKGVLDLGLNMPAPSYEYILKLAEAGLVTISDDGMVKWAKGVNKDNYQEKYDSIKYSLYDPITLYTMLNNGIPM